MLAAVLKPEYLYRPRQLMRRITHGQPHGYREMRLPWGATIRASADDNLGSQIATLGVYDLVTTETLWRLCDPTDTAIDVGANIGYMAFVLAERLFQGRVLCFEPHPLLFEELSKNIESLKAQGSRAEITLFEEALGPTISKLPLHVPKDFRYHRGESSLTKPSHLVYSEKPYLVPVLTLDSRLAERGRIGMVKLDVEGFELEVLKGGEQIFGNKQVRDCVFEEHRTYPTSVTGWFQQRGYQLFRLDRQLNRPCLLPPESSLPRTSWTANNYLATLEPERVEQRFAAPGWRCLRDR